MTDFSIDLQCETDAGPVPIPEPTTRSIYLGNHAAIGIISPTVMDPERGSVTAFGIGESGWAMFGVNLPPGATKTGLRLVSVMAPGLRQYALKPAFPADPAEWAYDDMTDPDLPWVTDFTVHGAIAGPGCPGVTPPVEQPRFDGTLQRPETEIVNPLEVDKQPRKQNELDGSMKDTDVFEIRTPAAIPRGKASRS